MSDTGVPERYLRLGENDVYGYTELLAQRKDATVIDGYAAAQLLRQQGITNEITERYPDALPLDPLPTPKITPGEQEVVDRAALVEARKLRVEAKAELTKRVSEFHEQKPGAIPDTSTDVVEESGPELSEIPISNTDIKDLLGDVTNRT